MRGWTANTVPLGSHSRTLVPPKPHVTIPTGILNRSAIASPNGGIKLPPDPDEPGWESWASYHRAPVKFTTSPDFDTWRSSPWFAELDWPAITKISPTPTFRTTSSLMTD
jgi:hypothetical protein